MDFDRGLDSQTLGRDADRAMQKICDLSDLPEHGGRACTIGGVDVAVITTPAGVRAFRNVCPHQGRSMHFGPGEFLFSSTGLLVCPHHGASFDPLDGNCVAGPCRGDALSPLKVETRDGVLWLVQVDG